MTAGPAAEGARRAAIAAAIAWCTLAATPREAGAQAADTSVVPRAFIVEYAQRYGGIYRLTPEQRETVRERATTEWRQLSAQERAQFIQRIVTERERQRDIEIQRRDAMAEEERARVRELERERADARRRQMLPPGGTLSRNTPVGTAAPPSE